MNSRLSNYLDSISNLPDTAVTQDLFLPISQCMTFIYHIRRDLQEAYTLTSKKDREDFLFWYLTYGVKEYKFLKLTPEQIEILNAPDTDVVQDCVIPLTKLLIFSYRRREDLKKAFPLDTKKNRNEFLFWWLFHGVNELPLLSLTEDQLTKLTSTSKPNSSNKENSIELPNILCAYYFYSDALQKDYNLDNPEDQKKLLKWYTSHATELFPFLYKKKSVALAENVSTPQNHIEENGVTIVGFPKGELGIGEDARMAAHAMESANIPYSIYNAPLQISSRTKSTVFDSKIESFSRYKTNLICLPGPVTFFAAVNEVTDCFSEHYNIGAWQWELPNWPKKWDPLFYLIDEIWAFSHYAENMFKKSTDKPVVYMPMCVEYPAVKPVSRNEFGLPENSFIFLTMFDGFSSIARKNPLATVTAFLKAFPKNKDVALVIKTMHCKNENSDWSSILKMAQHDERIHIINETIDHQKVMGLIDLCDAYVSLHRAEGFGRILAESMLLKKPVITTNFSGNTDFCNDTTAFVVNGPLVQIKPHEYEGWENQFWCDPDIEEAALQMQLCYQNSALRAQLAENGYQKITHDYSSKSVSERYLQRLKALSLIS